ncbi:hybrid sensor histidine kinase/response regulator [Kineosporia sp. NBRC 101677]|uniref:hybrid sensor histidine kinase/response regulator n=1 Tax=Kineosporia sp. NBRC 101677 TaxID=3032197 RepID=UPI0024A5C084|nr:response regulator [Kineosporia sp. NBRC 101677]GLY17633.1 hybrid sensor histidine kinase/response regulator [Kineosporia sp. NBRC 101677]
MSDLLQYFRIEARELVDELTVALSELARGGPAADAARTALRHAHTLKGAARVVGQTDMADRVHELEEMLGPHRNSEQPLPTAELDQMQQLVDGLSAGLEQLGGSEEPAPEAAPIPAPRANPEAPASSTLDPAPAERIPDPLPTARASLLEIDNLINGVVQTRTQLSTVRDGALRARRLRAVAEATGRLTDSQIEELTTLARILETSADRIDRELREVYTTAEQLRLIPVETIVPDLERGVRDVTAAQGKRARLEVRGAEIALDATILAGVQTALRQIVRNAVAHGVETPAQRRALGKDESGRVQVEISHGAQGVRFRCTDDGRGIDLDAVRRKLVQTGRAPDAGIDDAQVLQLLLGSGISTAGTVSEISGHGIGLDVVQDVVRRTGGRIEITTTPGQGTTIDLTTPATMTAQEVVLVRPTESADLAALPLRAVRQARRIGPDDFSGALAVRHNGRRIPYVPLADVLTLPADSVGPEENGRTVLLLEGGRGLVAVGVTRLVGTAEVAVRALPELAPVPPLVCGIWIDIDGRARPVLDPAEVAAVAATRRLPRVSTPVPLPPATASPTTASPTPGAPVPILIVDDSLTTRMLERSILQAAGYRVDEAGSAEEGLAMAARQRYAVAVVDVEMPGMNGFAFIEQTRTRPELRHMPCILVTTKAGPEDRERGRAAGARAHIDKGEFHQSTLLDAVARLVTEHTAERPSAEDAG